MATAAHNDTDTRAQVSDEEWAVRVDLAAAYRLVALYGWDDLIFTHLSARVPGPVPPHVVRRLFERIIDETRTLEREASGRG